MCKELKPVNNLDDLLYQFYVNLDSDCLFNMPAAELEKIWGIKITLKDMSQLPNNTPPNNDDTYKKPYKTALDAFFVNMIKLRDGKSIRFEIWLSEEFKNKLDTIYKDGNFPRFLPEPLKSPHLLLESPKLHSKDNTASADKISAGKYWMNEYRYFWLNTRKTHMILLNGWHDITGVDVQNYIYLDYINNYIQQSN